MMAIAELAENLNKHFVNAEKAQRFSSVILKLSLNKQKQVQKSSARTLIKISVS